MTATISVSWAVALTWAALTSTPERDLSRVHAMAVNSWYEAGDLSDAQLISIVVATRMRMKRTGADNIINAPNQFSWRLEPQKVRRGALPRSRGETQLFVNLLSIAWNAEIESISFPLTNYHRIDVSPKWKGLCEVIRNSYHIFYRPCAEPSADAAPPSVSPGAGAGATARGSLTPRGASVAPPFPERKPGGP
jgi:hypothetical protein